MYEISMIKRFMLASGVWRRDGVSALWWQVGGGRRVREDAVVVAQDLHAHLKGTSSIVHTTSQKAGSPMMSRPTISPHFWPECRQRSTQSSSRLRSREKASTKCAPPSCPRSPGGQRPSRQQICCGHQSHRNSVKHGHFRVQERLGERSARLGLRKGTHSLSSIAARYGER